MTVTARFEPPVQAAMLPRMCFPFRPGKSDPDLQALYLGDVALSLPRALDQAECRWSRAHPSCTLLVVHGVLHLLGYDHANTDQKEADVDVQAGILSQLGSQLLYLNPEH
jgi:probable rRNA maturation factor